MGGHERESGTTQRGDHETSSADNEDDEAKPIPPADKKDSADEKDAAVADAVADPNLVDWDSPSDPANPRNWSKKRKLLNTSLVSLSVLYSYVYPTPFPPLCQLEMHIGVSDYKYIYADIDPNVGISPQPCSPQVRQN